MEFSILDHCGKAIVVACWWYSSELEPMPLASLALSPFIKLQNWTQKVHFSYGQFSKFFFQASTIDCLQCLNPPLIFMQPPKYCKITTWKKIKKWIIWSLKDLLKIKKTWYGRCDGFLRAEGKYCISANSSHRNYSFLNFKNLENLIVSTLCNENLNSFLTRV